MSGDTGNAWNDHAEWWLEELEDPIYHSDVLPLLDRLVDGIVGNLLDLGCGEGRVMARYPGRVIGCDIAEALLRRAVLRGPVVRAELPHLGWLRTNSVDGAYMVLVVEHLETLAIMDAAARVVRPGGALVLVMNHPAFTAAGSGPIMDPSDGEVLWRWGDYFNTGRTVMPTPGGGVAFYHRPLARILNAAAAAGWMLVDFLETGLSKAALAAEPGYVGQEQMPRLLGARWMNTQGSRVIRR